VLNLANAMYTSLRVTFIMLATFTELNMTRSQCKPFGDCLPTQNCSEGMSSTRAYRISLTYNARGSVGVLCLFDRRRTLPSV